MFFGSLFRRHFCVELVVPHDGYREHPSNDAHNTHFVCWIRPSFPKHFFLSNRPVSWLLLLSTAVTAPAIVEPTLAQSPRPPCPSWLFLVTQPDCDD